LPKALFFNVPAHGHINPSLPLVAELVRRGHEITYVITENYRAKVEAAGAIFEPYATVHDDYFDARGLDGTRPQRAALALIGTAEDILPELLEITRRASPDYILLDGMCPWGKMVAQILGLPAVVSLALLPLTPLHTMLNWQMIRVIVPMLTHDFDKGLEANKVARALTKKYNLPPLGLTSILNAEGDLTVSYTSSYFQPHADQVSKTIRFVGWTVNETPPDQPFSFEQARDRRLVYISLGTLVSDNPAFFKSCIEAFTGTDYYVMMTTGNRVNPDSFGTLPENIVVSGWLPQIEILKRAALFITHAGLNSVHDGLYFGVPLLLVPQQAEQTFTASRVAELGAGLMLTKTVANRETIGSAASRLLTDPSFKREAEHIGQSFRAGGGMPRAADEIEALLRRTISRKA